MVVSSCVSPSLVGVLCDSWDFIRKRLIASHCTCWHHIAKDRTQLYMYVSSRCNTKPLQHDAMQCRASLVHFYVHVRTYVRTYVYMYIHTYIQIINDVCVLYKGLALCYTCPNHTMFFCLSVLGLTQTMRCATSTQCTTRRTMAFQSWRASA